MRCGTLSVAANEWGGPILERGARHGKLSKKAKNMSVSSRGPAPENLARSLSSAFSSPSTILQNFAAGAVIATINVATAISIGMLVFAGPLEPMVSIGIGLYLIGTAVSGFLVPIFSDYKAFVSGPRAGQAPIFAAMAASIALAMPGVPADQIAVTVITAFLVTTAIVGVVMYLVGLARMGRLIRAIPFPVMGGFFAGLGYLLLKGGVSISIGELPEGEGIYGLTSDMLMSQLAPAVAFGLLLFALQMKFDHKLLVPVCLALGIILFHCLLFLTDTSIEAAIDFGWLRSFDQQIGDYFPILTLSQLALVDWWVIALQYETIFVLCLLSIIILLIDVSGVEILTDKDLDPNKELKAAGIANIVGVPATSPLGFGSAPDTGVSYSLGGDTFLMIIFHTVFVVAVIVAGPDPIALIPPPLVGGFLIYLGLKFLVDWVWDKRQKLPLTDTLVILIILATVALYGVLEGVAVGILLATVLFVRRYSMLSVVKTQMNGAEYVSHIDRHVDHQEFLDKNGHLVKIFVLQGFLFFGSANQLLQKIRHSFEGEGGDEKRYLIIDFARVVDVDSSAANSFAKLMQICVRENITLCLAGDGDYIRGRLQRTADDLELPEGALRIFENLDSAAGWCDDQLLKPFGEQIPPSDSIAPNELLLDLIEDQSAVDLLSGYFENVEIAQGETLFEQGDPGDALYLILSGTISIVLNRETGPALTVRTMRVGSILGEMSVYSGAPRTATAVAVQNCVLFKLTTDKFRGMASDHPAEAELFSSYIVKLMAERLDRANKTVLALSR